jgi:hypothetical protein
LTGTQIHTLELIHALWRTSQLRLRILVPEDIGEYAVQVLDEMTGVERLVMRHAAPVNFPRSDLVHRPYQVTSADDLPLLHQAGERVVITNQDLIAYRNPSYFPTVAAWTDYRRLTREVLPAADHILFFSHHAEQDATRLSTSASTIGLPHLCRPRRRRLDVHTLRRGRSYCALELTFVIRTAFSR